MRPARRMARRPPQALARRPDAGDSIPAKAMDGLIIRHHGQTFTVEDEDGAHHRCSARRKVGALVCGDRVRWQPGEGGDGVILALRPRRSLLARPDSRGQRKPIAANLDQVVIVSAPQAETGRIDTGLIDRYLVAAELCGLRAAIVINKTDLFTPETRTEAERQTAVYRGIGYELLFISAKRGLGLTELTALLREGTGALVGPSGAGKSSLAQALLPDEDIRIGAVAAGGGGRHTTTWAMLYRLRHGGRLIDSPGVRDFRLWQATAAEIARGFAEFRSRAPACRFGDCLHLAEPGCAVRQAVEDGEIAAARYRSYRGLIESLKE